TRTPRSPRSCVERITASSPSCWRTSSIASGRVAAVKDLRRMAAYPPARRWFGFRASDLAHRADLRLGVDLVLRKYGRRGTEALDDRADVGADARTGEQRRRDTHHGLALEGLTDLIDELLELGGRHRDLPFLAFADQRIGEALLPVR